MRKLVGLNVMLFVVALVAAANLAGCASTQPFQAVSKENDTEKAIVEDAFKQAYNLTRTSPPKVSAAQYETIKTAYNVWAGAQRVRADIGTEWLKQINEAKASGKPAAVSLEDKYRAVARTAGAAYLSFIALVGDIVKLRTSEAPDSIPISALPLWLAILPFGVALRRKDAYGIMGGAPGDVDQILAAVKGVLQLLSGFQGKAAEYAAQGLNYLPYLVAAAHVAETAYNKIRDSISGGGTDFLAMTPEQYHAHFSPKSVEELEAEARAGK